MAVVKSIFFMNWLACLVVSTSVDNFIRGKRCKLCYSSYSLDLKGFNMRLTSNEIKYFKDSVIALDKSAQVFLFGSRLDDNKKGGDIDLLIISNKILQKELRVIKFNFYDEFGEQIDILLDDGSLKNPFNELVFQKAVEL